MYPMFCAKCQGTLTPRSDTFSYHCERCGWSITAIDACYRAGGVEAREAAKARLGPKEPFTPMGEELFRPRSPHDADMLARYFREQQDRLTAQVGIPASAIGPIGGALAGAIGGGLCAVPPSGRAILAGQKQQPPRDGLDDVVERFLDESEKFSRERWRQIVNRCWMIAAIVAMLSIGNCIGWCVGR